MSPTILDSKPARTPTLFSEPQCLITQFGVYVYCILFPDYYSVPSFPSTSTFFALPSHSHDSRLNRTHWPRTNYVFIPCRVMIGALILFGTGLQLESQLEIRFPSFFGWYSPQFSVHSKESILSLHLRQSWRLVSHNFKNFDSDVNPDRS